MSYMDTFGGRIQTARKNKSMSQDALAKLLGVSKQAVSNWETNSNYPSQGKIQSLVSLLNVQASWLLTGTTNDATNIDLGKQDIVGVPLYRFKELLRSSVINSYNSDRDLLPVYSKVGPKSFAITIDDDSMSPQYNAGDTVVIDPDEPPLPGDQVCALIPGLDRAIFRTFKSSGDDTEEFKLSAINQNWGEVKYGGEIIGVAIQHTKYRRKKANSSE